MVGIVGLVPLVGQCGKDAARAYIERGIRVALIAPGTFPQFGHPPAQLLACPAEPRVKVHHPVQLVEVEFLQVYVIVVYHCATVALKMSSTILSMISEQRALSTASSELVES